MSLESVRAFLAEKAPDIVIIELGGHDVKEFNKWSFVEDAPPVTLPPPLQALWWLKKGGLAMGPEWNQAHELCQTREGEHTYDLVHALVHWIEGGQDKYRLLVPAGWRAARSRHQSRMAADCFRTF